MEPTQDHPEPTEILRQSGEYRPIALFCPRCGANDRVNDYGSQLGCGKCGMQWQADMGVLEVWLNELKPPTTGASPDDTLPGIVPALGATLNRSQASVTQLGP